MHQLDVGLEVAVEVMLELLDFHQAGLLLLTAVVVLNLEVEVEVEWNCRSLDYHWLDLLLGTPPPDRLLPGPLLPLGAVPVGLLGSPLPEPPPPLLDPSGGPPPGGWALRLRASIGVDTLLHELLDCLLQLDGGGGGGGGNCLKGTGCSPGGVPKHGGSALPSRTPPEAVTEIGLHAVEGESSRGGSGRTS